MNEPTDVCKLVNVGFNVFSRQTDLLSVLNSFYSVFRFFGRACVATCKSCFFLRQFEIFNENFSYMERLTG